MLFRSGIANTMEEQLKIAISNENYEEAARLRDVIKEKHERV